MDTNTQPTDSPTQGRRNQRHAPEFKRAVVARSYLPSSSVARLAREHGINANQIFAWRKLYRDAGLTRASTNTTVLLPVHVAQSVPSEAVPALKAQTRRAGTIALKVGNAQLTICGSPDVGSLRTILAHLLR